MRQIRTSGSMSGEWNRSMVGYSGTGTRKSRQHARPHLNHRATPRLYSWSNYMRLMSVENLYARAFYESEAIRGGWSVRQLDRQIGTQFFERTSHSKQQAAMLARGQKPRPEDFLTVEDEVRDPYLLEFLNLTDEYSESDLEEALIRHLESFLLELGAGFTFVARQKRIRIGYTWYRIDLLLYHRGLRCLVVIDLKTGDFSHADAGQMNLYLNYVRQHLTRPNEAEPIGIILCSGKDDAVVEYAMGGINARVFASKYLTQLPDEETLRREIQTTKRALTQRTSGSERKE
jgi:predicted nuclease of restriction endonuclease-like (RecB) superfamily